MRDDFKMRPVVATPSRHVIWIVYGMAAMATALGATKVASSTNNTMKKNHPDDESSKNAQNFNWDDVF